jgi:5-formyltetrahydrofolate cyclo-ligase
MEKEDLRQEMKQARELLSIDERSLFSQKICESLAALTDTVHYSQIIGYWPLVYEVNILPFLQSQENHLNVYILSKNSQHLLSINTRLATAKPLLDMNSLRNFEETLSTIPFSKLEKKSLVICPGLAFGKDGTRIGYGGGYFDKLLSTKSLQFIKVGVSYSIQLIDTVPQQNGDQKMDWIITEKGSFKVGS